MIVLVPLSRYRVVFETASGRPYSAFEQLVLRAVQDGATTLQSLEAIFQVHPRLLVEALVTLTHEGWIAIGGPGSRGFVLTSLGRGAVDSGEVPLSLSVASRSTFVVMERLTGGLIQNNEIRYESRRGLGQHFGESLPLAPRISLDHLDGGQVQHLLPRRQGEWIRWIGPIDLFSKDAHWLPLNVDTPSEKIIGLPDAWEARLRPLIVDLVRGMSAGLDEKIQESSWKVAQPWRTQAKAVERGDPDALSVPPTKWPIALVPEDFLYTAEDHDRYLEKVLSEAKSAVLIASAFLSVRRMESLKSQVLRCLSRGVDVDLLWGYATSSEDQEQGAIDWLKKMSYEAKRDGATGKLRFNSSPSNSHAKLLLWDGDSGSEGIVGSYNWLSADPFVASLPKGAEGVTNVSVRLSHPGLLAALSRCVAGLWAGAETESLSSTSDRWGRAAARLDQSAVRMSEAGSIGGTNAEVRLVLDREHDAIVREWLSVAQQRLLVVSHRLGQMAENRLFAGTNRRRRTQFSYQVVYGRSDLDDDGVKRVERVVSQSSGILQKTSGLHAKLLVGDDRVCVSSYNFLSADQFGTAEAAREVGIVLEGSNPADWVWARFLPRVG